MALGGSAARRYAEALLEIAAEESAVDAFRASLDRLASAFEPGVIRALRDPKVTLERRRAAVAAAARDEPKAIRATLDLLLQRDRIELLPGIAQHADDVRADRLGDAVERLAITIDAALLRGDLEERLRVAPRR